MMLNEPLRFSRFTHLFRKDGIVTIFHALKLRTVFFQETLSSLIQEFQYGMTPDKILAQIGDEEKKESFKQLISKLERFEILVPIHYDEMSTLEKIQKNHLRVSISILYLLLTDKCNFRCDYCFVENAMPASYKFSQMNQGTTKAALDFFAECLTKNPEDFQSKEKTIIFYGGEPLLNKEAFKFALEYIQTLQQNNKLPAKLKIALNTNGSLIDKEITGLIAQYGVRPSVSLDGPQEIHNKLRKSSFGENTFEEVIRGYRMLQREKIPVSISCTIGPHNIQKLEEIFDWFKDELNVRGLGFNLFLNAPGVETNTEYAREATTKIIRCYEIARRFGIYEDRIMRKVKAFVERKPHFIDCGGCGRQIVVSPDGKIGVCHAYTGSKKYFVGDITKAFNPFTDSTFVEWSKRSPLNMPQCFDCEALGICGGGCVHNAEINSGSIWTTDRVFCIHSKEILQWLVWDLYASVARMKGGEKNGKGMVCTQY